MVECIEDAKITFKKKCELLNVARGSMYYKPKKPETNDAMIMNEMRYIYHESGSSYGYRRMVVGLRSRGFIVNHKKVAALQKQAGIQAIYPCKKTTIRNQAHKVFPYLLKGLSIDRPNQVWQVDITYIKIPGGFVYLVALIDVFSRKIMGWSLSTSLDMQSCLRAFNNALQYGMPDIVNSDQGSQFTSEEWVVTLQGYGIKISMDGKGRWIDNVYIERLWRTIKYELVFLRSFDTVIQARIALDQYINFYNTQRYHSKLNYHTPDVIFAKKRIPSRKELFERFMSKNSNQQEATVV